MLYFKNYLPSHPPLLVYFMYNMYVYDTKCFSVKGRFIKIKIPKVIIVYIINYIYN